MMSLPEILEWIASHGKRFARPGYTPPNHLANGKVRLTSSDGSTTITLDAQGATQQTPPDSFTTRVEVYDSEGALLYSEDS